MQVIVTCGPSYEPIDRVRRLTNFSSGELGVHLSNQLARAGFEVFCLKGSGATYPSPAEQEGVEKVSRRCREGVGQWYWHTSAESTGCGMARKLRVE